jgi:hypothetical protein
LIQFCPQKKKEECFSFGSTLSQKDPNHSCFQAQLRAAEDQIMAAPSAFVLATRCDQEDGNEWWVPYPTACMEDLRSAVLGCEPECWVFGGGQAYRVVFEYKEGGKFDVAHQVNAETGTQREVRKFPGTPEGFMQAQMQGDEALTTYISEVSFQEDKAAREERFVAPTLCQQCGKESGDDEFCGDTCKESSSARSGSGWLPGGRRPAAAACPRHPPPASTSGASTRSCATPAPTGWIGAPSVERPTQ